MDAEHGRIDPVLVDKQPTLKKEKCLLRLANLKGFDANFTKLLMCSGRWGWMSDLDKVLVHKATVFRRKGGGWAKIAAGMVGGGKEEANGAAADGSFERYKSVDAGKRLSWPESRGSPNRTDEG
jgi:hypothetical protein